MAVTNLGPEYGDAREEGCSVEVGRVGAWFGAECTHTGRARWGGSAASFLGGAGRASGDPLAGGVRRSVKRLDWSAKAGFSKGKDTLDQLRRSREEPGLVGESRFQ